MNKVKARIIQPTMDGLASEGILYKGFIFFGLINVNGDPYVIEYNARLGDPESEVIIPRISSDFFELIEGVAYGTLADKIIEFDNRFVTTVMLVSGGYPGSYKKGIEISGLNNVKDSVVFHAGTKMDSGKVVTAGGRVLSVSSWGQTLREALSCSFRSASKLSFENMYYRTDIGFDL